MAGSKSKASWVVTDPCSTLQLLASIFLAMYRAYLAGLFAVGGRLKLTASNESVLSVVVAWTRNVVGERERSHTNIKFTSKS